MYTVYTYKCMVLANLIYITKSAPSPLTRQDPGDPFPFYACNLLVFPTTPKWISFHTFHGKQPSLLALFKLATGEITTSSMLCTE
jgi:hypothetical protein